MLDRNRIAALLESLCERPFGRDQEGQASALEASDLEQALSNAEAERPFDQAEPGPAKRPGRVTAELASILSGTATSAQRHGFQESAVTSGAARLEAQSALAFVEGIAHAPLAAPVGLVEEVLGSVGGAPPRPRPSVWSNLMVAPFGRRRGRLAAACALLLAGGLSWSLLRAPADMVSDHAVAPAAIPEKTAPIGEIDLRLAPAPPSTPTPGLAAAPAPAPPSAVQALSDPCAPRNLATSEAGGRSRVETNPAKPAPIPPSKTASVSAPDPGCAVSVGASEAGRDPQADQGSLRAARPAAKIGTLDRNPAASAPASAPYAARPASPAMHPSAVQPPH